MERRFAAGGPLSDKFLFFVQFSRVGHLVGNVLIEVNINPCIRVLARLAQGFEFDHALEPEISDSHIITPLGR